MVIINLPFPLKGAQYRGLINMHSVLYTRQVIGLTEGQA